MSSPGHRKTARRPRSRAAAPVVGVTALAAAALATLAGAAPAELSAQHVAQPTRDVISASLLGDRAEPPVSRSAERPPLPGAVAAQAQAVGTMFLIDDTEVRSAADADAAVLAVLEKGAQVAVTEVQEGGYRQIVHEELPRWVPEDRLSATEPQPEPPPPQEIGLSAAPCPIGSAVESGLRPDTIAVYRAVCAAFPAVSSYGGVAGRGEHATGQALDIMVSGPAGWQIAEFLQAHATELGVDYLIYQQKIWSTERPGEGWRPMSDRGGATANHEDHVHVTTHGSAGRR